METTIEDGAVGRFTILFIFACLSSKIDRKRETLLLVAISRTGGCCQKVILENRP